jgi:hypothetical protein
MRVFFILLVSTVSNFGFSQSNLERFNEIVSKAKMNFVKAHNLFEIPIDTVSKIEYEYSMKYPDYDFFVLYSVKPLSVDGPKEKYVSKDENGNIMDQHIARFQHIIFEIFADEYFDYKVFDSLAVRKEFNADWGASSSFTLKKTSFQEKKYCTVVALHKENAADVLIYFISNTKDEFDAHLIPLFYNLRFLE